MLWLHRSLLSLLVVLFLFVFFLSSVIVSQWTSMLQVVALHLRKQRLTYATIDGSVNPKQRMDLVEAFNHSQGPQVLTGHSRPAQLRSKLLVIKQRNVATQLKYIQS